jgi:IS5 family transposase
MLRAWVSESAGAGIFLAEMESVAPWKFLLALIEPHCPMVGQAASPMRFKQLPTHFLQQWYAMSDPGMEGALYEIPTLRHFARLSGVWSASPTRQRSLPSDVCWRRTVWRNRSSSESTPTWHVSDQSLRAGTSVDDTIIAAPSLTKDQDGGRAPERLQTKKGKQWQ